MPAHLIVNEFELEKIAFKHARHKLHNRSGIPLKTICY